ncbi:hypothetical protein AA0113_g5847 [Alternaria arborescens]|uniref:Uncharacterized protein n=1 Tax=Alternaria arborescens TaxID=156630 RepID=A0A4Q4S4M2_9PLEO|nr:hypothetical protein AA0113_g5847 [Alternaria arborescens]
MASSPIRQAFEKILTDKKNRGLPPLEAENYDHFLAAVSSLLANPAFIDEHSWQTQTLEHSISRPTFNAVIKEDCETKLDVRLEVGEELDSSGKVVFVGNVVRITVDGHVLAKGRSNLWAADALLLALKKVIAMAGQWE